MSGGAGRFGAVCRGDAQASPVEDRLKRLRFLAVEHVRAPQRACIVALRNRSNRAPADRSQPRRRIAIMAQRQEELLRFLRLHWRQRIEQRVHIEREAGREMSKSENLKEEIRSIKRGNGNLLPNLPRFD